MKTYPVFSRLSSFTGRAVVFFVALSALLFFFFMVGNTQEFLDSTQLFLLSSLRLSLGLELICGLYLVGFLVTRNILERRPFLLRWLLLLLSMAACGSLLLVLRYVQSWLQD